MDLELTQEELAPRLLMKPAQLSQLENGRYYPSLKMALFLSKVLTELTGKPILVNDLYELEKKDL